MEEKEEDEETKPAPLLELEDPVIEDQVSFVTYSVTFVNKVILIIDVKLYGSPRHYGSRI